MKSPAKDVAYSGGYANGREWVCHDDARQSIADLREVLGETLRSLLTLHRSVGALEHLRGHIADEERGSYRQQRLALDELLELTAQAGDIVE